MSSHPKRTYRKAAAVGGDFAVSTKSPDLLAGVAAVTGEAGMDSRQSGQDVPSVKAEGNHPPASSQAPQERAEGMPQAYRTDEVLSACRIIEEAAAKRSSGFFGVTLTQEQYRHLAFAVLCQVEGLVESEEADEPEVQEALRCLQEFQGNLKRAAKNHAIKNGNAKGSTSWRKDARSLFDKEAEL